MKVFFDTNVYVAEALLGEAAVRMFDATVQGNWRIHLCRQILNEIRQVLVEQLGFSGRTDAIAGGSASNPDRAGNVSAQCP